MFLQFYSIYLSTPNVIITVLSHNLHLIKLFGRLVSFGYFAYFSLSEEFVSKIVMSYRVVLNMDETLTLNEKLLSMVA
jgi:hypothetical protein